MKLKIIKPSLALKIHRKLILAQKIMKLFLDFLNDALYYVAYL